MIILIIFVMGGGRQEEPMLPDMLKKKPTDLEITNVW